MSCRTARRALIPVAFLLGLLVPASASAWQVVVQVHGAGAVSEVTNRNGDTRNQGTCSVSAAGKGESSLTNCTLGTLNGFWSHGDIVRLSPSVPQEAFDRGWRYLKWVDGTATKTINNVSHQQINCDAAPGEPNPTGDHFTPTYCEFQIFNNYYVDLYFDDVEGPQDTSLAGAPPANTNQTSASVTFDATSDPDARFDCKLDRPGLTGSWYQCGTPSDKAESYSNLTANGTYTLSVRGRDLSGNVDATPVSRSWTVDTVNPSPSITGGPTGTVSSKTASFTFTTNEGSMTCRLDDGPVEACGGAKSYSNLSEGPHTFTVAATDAAGNTGAVARVWTVDTIAPVPTITGGPASRTTDRTASFDVGTNEGVLTCRLDTGPTTACSDPMVYSDLADGAHAFTLTAVDAAGNQATLTRNWTVDTAGPTVTYTAGPADGAHVSATGTTFEFVANEAATFECSRNGGAFAPCTSPQAFADLAEGEHSLAVRATDDLSNAGATVTRRFVVDRTAPETTLLDGPAEGSTTPDSSATLTFASPESASTFECRLDDAAFSPCSSPVTLSNLSNGDHSFEVRAVDRAGNADATPPRRTWRVNNLDADADGINRPQDCNDADPAIKPGAADVADDGIDQDCDGADRVDLDRDRDGVSRPQDCNDASAAIRPGALDVPGNKVDEDCSGGDAAVPAVTASLAYKFRVAGARTRVILLKLSKLTPGATVTVACAGKRCPIKSKRIKRPRSGVVDVRKLVRTLPARAKLTLRVAAPGTVTKIVTFKTRRGKAPTGGKFLCLPAGAKKPVRC